LEAAGGENSMGAAGGENSATNSSDESVEPAASPPTANSSDESVEPATSPPRVRTRLQKGIRNPKKYINGTVRYGMLASMMRHGVDDIKHRPVGNPKRKV
jgi:hypothetical protein